MLEIDASMGEGGGQILRSALSLALVTRRPIRLTRVRARRPRPGLQAQHLKAVEAAAAVSAARVKGAEPGSQTLEFAPGEVRGGALEIDIGTAGSTLLVLQTVFVPLALARHASTLALSGGTHNPWSPPFHYVAWQWLPWLERIGYRASITLERAGFYPAGGGRIRAEIRPALQLEPLRLVERGALRRIRGLSGCAGLALEVAQRQSGAAAARLGRYGVPLEIADEQVDAASRGTFIVLGAEFENSRSVASALGAPGKRAERVGEEAAQGLERAIDSGAAVDEHLADQLVLPLLFAAGESRVTTASVTRHLLSNVELVGRFLPGAAEVRGAEGEPGELVVRGGGRPAWWNVIVTTTRGRPQFFAALEGLRRLGVFRPTAFKDVCVGRVEDQAAFLESVLAAKAAAEPWAEAVARAIPVERSFVFAPDTLAAQLKAALVPLAGRMGAASFHLRLERRGFEGRVQSDRIEREVADQLYAVAESRGVTLRTRFSDPDFVLAAETAGAECGVALLSRALREQYPFVAAR